MEDQIKKENVFVRAGRKVKAAGAKVVDVVMRAIDEKPELIVPIASGLFAIIGGGFRLIKDGRANWESQCEVEDDISGVMLKTRHPLSNEEILELDERISAGGSKGKELQDMGLLR